MGVSRHWLGFVMASCAALAAAGYGIAQILQVFGLVGYPLDQYLIFGFSLLAAPFFLVAMAAFHFAVPFERRAWTMAAAMFAVMYAVVVGIVYVTQLFVAIPEALAGHAAEVLPLTIYVRSFLWSANALGYVCMSLATLMASFAPYWRWHSWLKAALLAHGIQAPVIILILFRPELVVWGAGWLLTTPVALFTLAVHFGRTARPVPRI